MCDARSAIPSFPGSFSREGRGSFESTLARHGLDLRRGGTHTLQVNLGLLCNQACRHCHLDAGPSRAETMSPRTMEEVVSYAGRAGFETIDLTGGAPEMFPGLARLIESLAPLTRRLMLRSNLTAVGERDRRELIELCKVHRVVIVASLPSANAGQTDAQRGHGVWDDSIRALRALNEAGYGRGDGLELNLVSNPAGAFLPPPQGQIERKFRSDLERRWGIAFDRLFVFANAPLGRFRSWLKSSGNLEPYLKRLLESFNPCTVDGLMCRSLVSVSWDGYLFDCDFNLGLGIPLGGAPRHVSKSDGPPAQGTPISTGDHCYACTAGAGFG